MLLLQFLFGIEWSDGQKDLGDGEVVTGPLIDLEGFDLLSVMVKTLDRSRPML